MIHIATAHHHSSEWIELQRARLDRHIDEPFRLYGSLEGVEAEFEKYFDVVVPSKGGHAGKLNLLGHLIVEEADPDDLVMFLDGDAFPVRDVIAPVREALAGTGLVAVQRLENWGDTQPHPCFCVTTARLWRDLPGDWSSGHIYRDGRTDVGANLAWLLERRGIAWTPLLRTHSLRSHDLLFAVYGGLVYHHGAGFRGLKPPGQGSDKWEPRIPESQLRVDRMERMRRNHPEKFERFLSASMDQAQLSQDVYQEICADPDYFEGFFTIIDEDPMPAN